MYVSSGSRTVIFAYRSVPDDAFARYVVHCCARLHGVVSFSKDDPLHRLTHHLRPNVTQPTHVRAARRAAPVPDTPPPTRISPPTPPSTRATSATRTRRSASEASVPQLLSSNEWSVVDANA
ncbi:hypothetical protein WOLCODRAFT_164382 [Wolfiporia cocos MD-104 SS10]|uniref:Uncharacterized protein n=1 Tax=Wolfiporia cocos (strain MD-104) TaxID=742152 RepID=A0A2H3JZQ8_WOLCO|nr:hypothetical protein WOLCODRAFT_164382 [Wolfiporia cocos MD-104 SS10]